MGDSTHSAVASGEGVEKPGVLLDTVIEEPIQTRIEVAVVPNKQQGQQKKLGRYNRVERHVMLAVVQHTVAGDCTYLHEGHHTQFETEEHKSEVEAGERTVAMEQHNCYSPPQQQQLPRRHARAGTAAAAAAVEPMVVSQQGNTEQLVELLELLVMQDNRRHRCCPCSVTLSNSKKSFFQIDTRQSQVLQTLQIQLQYQQLRLHQDDYLAQETRNHS